MTVCTYALAPETSSSRDAHGTPSPAIAFDPSLEVALD